MKVETQRIPLSRFIDFVVKTGEPKLTCVRQTKQQLIEGYHPSRDFYKAFREEVVAMHRAGDPIERLANLCDSLEDERKISNYKILLAGYKKFYKRYKNYVFSEPSGADWDAGKFLIKVNPELCLESADERLVIKLYLKELKGSGRRQVDTILHLLRTALDYDPSSQATYCVLDVRAGKLYRETKYSPEFTALLRGEADSFGTIFDLI